MTTHTEVQSEPLRIVIYRGCKAEFYDAHDPFRKNPICLLAGEYPAAVIIPAIESTAVRWIVAKLPAPGNDRSELLYGHRIQRLRAIVVNEETEMEVHIEKGGKWRPYFS